MSAGWVPSRATQLVALQLGGLHALAELLDAVGVTEVSCPTCEGACALVVPFGHEHADEAASNNNGQLDYCPTCRAEGTLLVLPTHYGKPGLEPGLEPFLTMVPATEQWRATQKRLEAQGSR